VDKEAIILAGPLQTNLGGGGQCSTYGLYVEHCSPRLHIWLVTLASMVREKSLTAILNGISPGAAQAAISQDVYISAEGKRKI